ncbi:GTP cyclohydrolase I FolE [Cryomorpha ignava]|uniref:GTP cyclohydrolase 1 n=1 Tax=Cryomorpha ignava TaxID=101383 RepID=A0A7K3WM33_9FLAO|nr:GTP cyclohydrolase I FolE [Cryomorpha ignava]NEN22081.1 GTP cyclohydrolase I FolE [Cryomorpha ignava]
MKLNGTLSNMKDELKVVNSDTDEHIFTNAETPMRADAFALSDEDKMERISHHFREIMDTLGLDLTDDSLKGTPARVAKMYVKEIFSGLNPENKPAATLFENKFGYNQMLVQKNITLKSMCEHHFVPIEGVVHIGYISNGYVIGLSKMNRIVQYFGKRPQVQERLSIQIAEELKRVLRTDDVAVVIDASHKCVSLRGVEDEASSTVTSSYHGRFRNQNDRNEFLKHL